MLSHNIRLKISKIKIKIISKLQLIQDCALRRITNVYKTTFTKVLKIEINVSLINVYLEKLI